ncbi:MAG: radical SAM protein [Planctomycetota bacterium]|nr:radical SAM protein [Planctomycetota bacterium]
MKLVLHKPLFRHQYHMEYRYYLGFGYLKAYLQQHLPEVQVEIVHSEQEIREARPDVIGFSTVSEMYTHVQAMHRRLRTWFDGLVLFGGPHMTAVPETLPKDAKAVAFIGEGEVSVTQFLKRLLGKSNGLEMAGPSPGTGIWLGDELVRGPAAEYVDINTLPMPADAPTAVFPFTTVRGCPYRCTHCVESWTQGTKVRILTAEGLADMCVHRYENYGTTVFELLDDLFLVSAPRLFELVDILDKRGVIERFEFIRLSLMAHMITDKVAEALSRLNVRLAGMGVESADPEIIRKFKGGAIKLDHIESAIRNCTKYGVGIGASMVLGYPGESEEQMRRTIDFYADRVFKTSFEFWENYVCQPLPGSTLWKRALDENRVSFDMDFSTLRIDADINHFDTQWYYGNEEHVPRDRYVEILKEYDLLRDGHFVKDRDAVSGEPKTDVFVRTYVPENVARRMTLQKLRAWKAADGRPVAVFGAGRHTRKIMLALIESPVEIACICDDDPEIVGRRLGRWDVIAAEDMLADPTIGAILVSSDMRQDELLDRLYPLAGDRYSLLTIYQPEELSRRRAEGKAIDEAQLALAH